MLIARNNPWSLVNLGPTVQLNGKLKVKLVQHIKETEAEKCRLCHGPYSTKFSMSLLAPRAKMRKMSARLPGV